MFTQQIEHITSLKSQLDDCFDTFADTAKQLAERFQENIHEEGLVPQILLFVSRDKRYRSINIRWARVDYKVVDGMGGVAVCPLPKDRKRNQYADSAFSYLPEDTRAIAIKYEQALAIVRQATKQNRAFAESLGTKIREFQRLQALLDVTESNP